MATILQSEASALATEQRRAQRYAFRLAVMLVRGRKETLLVTEDVSYHGLFLETDDVPTLRQLLRLRLLIPPFQRELTAFGMAVHHAVPRGARSRPRGAGVQLYALDRAARTIWENFVTSVRLGELEGLPSAR